MPQYFIEVATIIIIKRLIFYRPWIIIIHLIIGDIDIVVFAVLCPTCIILLQNPNVTGVLELYLIVQVGTALSSCNHGRNSLFPLAACSEHPSGLLQGKPRFYPGIVVRVLTLCTSKALSSIFKPNKMGKHHVT